MVLVIHASILLKRENISSHAEVDLEPPVPGPAPASAQGGLRFGDVNFQTVVCAFLS